MRICLAQLCSGPDPEANLQLIEAAADRAAAVSADLLVLPEATMRRFGLPLREIAEPADGPWAGRVREFASNAGLTIVVGMFTPAPDGRIHNSVLVASARSSTHYDKIHLYDAFGFTESKTVAPGSRPLVVDVVGVSVGVATCYDVRFPGLFQALADAGAQVVVLPASWGAGPGKVDQWRLLARARALDATVYVAACGQADPRYAQTQPTEPSRRRGASAPTGVGHSLVAAPDGRVIGELGAAPGFLTVDVDPAVVESFRTALPVLSNRRF